MVILTCLRSRLAIFFHCAFCKTLSAVSLWPSPGLIASAWAAVATGSTLLGACSSSAKTIFCPFQEVPPTFPTGNTTKTMWPQLRAGRHAGITLAQTQQVMTAFDRTGGLLGADEDPRPFFAELLPACVDM